MTETMTHTDLVAHAETNLAVAEAGSADPYIAAQIALASAILAARPQALRDHPIDLTELTAVDDGSPAAAATRAILASIAAAQTELDEIQVDDCGFPIYQPT